MKNRKASIYIPDIDDLFSIFVIGDTHFRDKHMLEGEELVQRCVSAVSNAQPSMIILLGDVLDTHEVARSAPYKLAYRFIEELSNIAPTYVLIGNHDFINNSQFLTDNHFFNPLKRYPNVKVVDRPTVVEHGEYMFVMCPYVPTGRFIEALNTLLHEGVNWELATCIFAHQELRGVALKPGEISENGDLWDENYPPIISGHIHQAQTINENIYYTGSAQQISFDEDPDKRVWHISFSDDGTLNIDKIDLELKNKKEVTLTIDEIKTFDRSLADKYYVKIKLKGTSEQLKLFRKSPQYAKLVKLGVKIDPITIREEDPLYTELKSLGRGFTSFQSVLKEVVKRKSNNIRNVYTEIFGELPVSKVELVFVRE